MKLTKYLILLIITISCKSQEIGKDILVLKKVDSTFNVDKFYSKVKTLKEYHQAMEDDSYNNHREKGFNKGTLSYSEEHIKTIDSLFFKKSKKLVGVRFNMHSWNTSDTIAYFGTVPFYKIEMMKSVHNNFMTLEASGNGYKADFNNLIKKAIQLYGEPKINTHHTFGTHYVYSWNTPETTLVITSRYNTKEEATFKITKPFSYYDTKLYLINNAYNDVLTEVNYIYWED